MLPHKNQKVIVQQWKAITQTTLNQKWAKDNLFLSIQKLTETSQIESVCNSIQDLEHMRRKRAHSNMNLSQKIK
jgi:hypothetical protein